MYFNILKKDLKRKRTMNIIVFLFIILAATFVSSSVNNLMTISNAMDAYIEKTGVADFTVVAFESGKDGVDEFAKTNENIIDYNYIENPMISNKNVKLNDGKFDFSNSICVASLSQTGYKIFDEKNQEITNVNDGEIRLPKYLVTLLDIKIGDTITIYNGDFSKEYEFVGADKDIVYGSAMAGITRLIVSENDYNDIMKNADFTNFCAYGFNSDDVEQLQSDFSKTGIATFVVLDIPTVKIMYVMDMVTAGIMLIVSVCLIIISIVILRFTIMFTLNEEFREIGVMKAIGIRNRKIRGIYITKYFAISVVGAVAGFFAGIPFGKLLIKEVSNNIVMDSSNNLLISLLCCIAIVFVVVMFCYLSTAKVKKITPIDAIRNGSNGERFKRKSILNLNKTKKMSTVPFLALNDILSGLRKFGVMIIAFTLGLILIIVPVMTMDTLTSDNLVTWFGMAESDAYISKEMMFSEGGDRQDVIDELGEIENKLKSEDMPCEVFKETIFKFTIAYGDKAHNSISSQGTGISADRYTYMDGSGPENANEVAITHMISDKIGAKIGDTVSINNGDKENDYIVTGIYQTMNNMGEGIRFYQDADINYSYAMGQFAMQIKFTDNPTQKVIDERLEKIQKLYPDDDIQTGGEYISDMMGGIADSMVGMRNLIVIVVLTINVLVSVLMIKSFITKEKGEIGMLKAIGFKNKSLVYWQTLRIGIVLVISVILGVVLSNPIAQISSGQVFKMMGASSIDFEVNVLQCYVIYPLIVLGVTLLASFLTSQQVRKISATETSNIE